MSHQIVDITHKYNDSYCTWQMYQTNSLECPIEGRVRIYGWGGSFINGTKAVNSHWIMVWKPTNFIWQHPEWCFRSEIGNSLFQWDSLTVWYKTKFGSQSFGYQPSVHGLPKLVANISYHFHHLVNTGLAVGSFGKWLPIKVPHTSKIDKFEWFIARQLEMAPSNCNHL